VTEPTLGLATPERVALKLPIAGIGSRAIAWLVDAGLLFGVAVTLYFGLTLAVHDPLDVALGLSSGVRLAWALGGFGALWGYWTALEVLWHGQTVGKRLVGVRVVRADGSPVTALDSAVRNLMRAVDFLPVCYPVGLVTMLLDARHRRLGDLVAGTVLVRDEVIDLDRYLRATGDAPGQALGLTELELVTGFLARFEALEDAARLRLGGALLARLGLEPAADAEEVRRALEAAVGHSGASAIGRFVAERRPAWLELQALVALRPRGRSLADLGRLDRLYRHASLDLARAQARYPGTDVHRSLNQLCGRAYAAIYRAPGDALATVRHFFATTFPGAVRQTLPYTAVAGGLIALGTIAGATTVLLQPDGLALLVDPSVREFIAHRELWTDRALEQHPPTELAALIFTNNLEVAFGAFALGVTFGLGTVGLALFNGLSLGATAAGCAQAGLLPGLLAFMAAHGPVELSLLSLTAGAGLVIGHALIDPGERSRGAWVRERAGLAAQVVLGCVPFLVVTGVVEAFVSPGSFFPWPVKLAAGAASFAGFWRSCLGARGEATSRD
jgi:uncharacterized membrane protein SpoIIM required for sporulation/uncharacterized RDD family membrane protein YckC